MIYLDTSAFIKLYLLENGSDWVNETITAQDDPLPFWFLHRVEMRNALNLKVFRGELKALEADRLIQLMTDRLRAGIYVTPQLDVADLGTIAAEFTVHTRPLGCRSLDILHVAAAHLIKPSRFITFDDRQRQLADRVGLATS